MPSSFPRFLFHGVAHRKKGTQRKPGRSDFLKTANKRDAAMLSNRPRPPGHTLNSAIKLLRTYAIALRDPKMFAEISRLANLSPETLTLTVNELIDSIPEKVRPNKLVAKSGRQLKLERLNYDGKVEYFKDKIELLRLLSTNAKTPNDVRSAAQKALTEMGTAIRKGILDKEHLQKISSLTDAQIQQYLSKYLGIKMPLPEHRAMKVSEQLKSLLSTILIHRRIENSHDLAIHLKKVLEAKNEIFEYSSLPEAELHKLLAIHGVLPSLKKK